MIKTNDLSLELQEELSFEVNKYSENNKSARNLKRKNFNHIDENTEDYKEYLIAYKKANCALNSIIRIKNYRDQVGYNGKSNQDLARLYATKNSKVK